MIQSIVFICTACVLVLAVVVAASPKIQTVDGIITVKSDDLQLVNGDNDTISINNVSSGLQELDSWRVSMESTAATCPDGQVVVGTTATGGQTCSDDLQQSIQTMNSFLTGSISTAIVEVNSRIQNDVSSIQSTIQHDVGNIQSTFQNDVSSIRSIISANTAAANADHATSDAAISTASSQLASLTDFVADFKACRIMNTSQIYKFNPSDFTFVNRNLGYGSTPRLTTGSNVWGTISCGTTGSNCDDAFDGKYGLWGPDGNSYYSANGQGGGIEIRFANPVRITNWTAMCIRNTGDWTQNNDAGSACYSNGAYDYSGITVSYFANNRWNTVGTLNQRQSGNWKGAYTGFAKSRNWRVFFSAGGSSGRCQHPSSCGTVYISEIDLYSCSMGF